MRKYFSSKFWAERDIELFIGKFLRYGVVSASCTAFLGGIFYLYAYGGSKPDYRIFHSEPREFRSFIGVFRGLLNKDSAAIIQLGVIFLIATPILRVLFSAIAFLMEKDYLYTIITLFVFSMILFSMLNGLGG